MRKIILCLLIYIIPLSSADIISVSEGGSNYAGKLPFYGLYNYSQTGIIISDTLLSEVQNKNITGLEFEFTNWSSGYSINNQNIKLGYTEEDFFIGAIGPDYSQINASNLITTKSDFDLIINNGWMTINFDTHFSYTDTTKNLLISWENYDGSWAPGSGGLLGGTTFGISQHWFEDHFYPDALSMNKGYLPNMRLHVSPIPEPTTIFLLSSCSIGLIFLRKKYH